MFGNIDSTNFDFLKRSNIEWVTMVTWSYQEDYDSVGLVHHHGDSITMRKRDSSWVKRLKRLRSSGFKVFFKPHIWIYTPSNGTWRSDIFPTSDDNWEAWKKSYRDFILRYAIVAEEAKVEMFCVGTELTKLTIGKPEFWKTLIKDVREVFSGEITYAANWSKEYEDITFWDDLDYIGIQAYFPLTENKNPSIEQISEGWNAYLPTMDSLSKKFNKQILFTEIGYKSTADSAINPWEWIDGLPKGAKSYSTQTQANCYEAFFNTVWPKDWFAGAHIWQMRPDYPTKKNIDGNIDFTPLLKPAEKVIANGFE